MHPTCSDHGTGSIDGQADLPLLTDRQDGGERKIGREAGAGAEMGVMQGPSDSSF